jgi:hypothetical protein
MPLEGGWRRADESGGPRGHRWSRGKEGTQSGRVSRVGNVETPSWSVSGERAAYGRPIARGAEFQAGKDGREANAGGRKAAGKRGRQCALLRGGARDNRPDTSSCWARKGADASQVSP